MLMKNEPILRSHRRAEPPGVRAVSGEMREVERKKEIMMAPTARRDFFRGENYQKSEGEVKNEGMTSLTSLVTLPSLSMSSSLETESTETGFKINPLELLLFRPMLIFNTNEKRQKMTKGGRSSSLSDVSSLPPPPTEPVFLQQELVHSCCFRCHYCHSIC